MYVYGICTMEGEVDLPHSPVHEEIFVQLANEWAYKVFGRVIKLPPQPLGTVIPLACTFLQTGKLQVGKQYEVKYES